MFYVLGLDRQSHSVEIQKSQLGKLQNPSASAKHCSTAFCVDKLQRWPRSMHKVHDVLSVRSPKIMFSRAVAFEMGSLCLTEYSDRCCSGGVQFDFAREG